MALQLSTPYTDPESSNSPPQNLQRSTIGYLSNSWAYCFICSVMLLRVYFLYDPYYKKSKYWCTIVTGFISNDMLSPITKMLSPSISFAEKRMLCVCDLNHQAFFCIRLVFLVSRLQRLYSTSSDCRPRSLGMRHFCSRNQNKILFIVIKHLSSSKPVADWQQLIRRHINGR